MLLIFLISELHSKLFHIPNECFFYLDNLEMASKTRWVLGQFGTTMFFLFGFGIRKENNVVLEGLK